MRNVWLFPLAIALAGSAIKLAAYLCLAPWSTTMSFAFSSLTSYAMLLPSAASGRAAEAPGQIPAEAATVPRTVAPPHPPSSSGHSGDGQ